MFFKPRNKSASQEPFKRIQRNLYILKELKPLCEQISAEDSAKAYFHVLIMAVIHKKRVKNRSKEEFKQSLNILESKMMAPRWIKWARTLREKYF